MFTLETSSEVNAPVEAVFAYVVDPAHQPEWDPGVDAVKAIQRLPDGRYADTSVSKLLGLPLDLKEEQVEVIPNERIVLATQSTGLGATSTFRFEPQAGGKTRMSFVSEITMHGPGPLARFGESVLAKYMDHGIAMGMTAVKAHIEAEAMDAAAGG